MLARLKSNLASERGFTLVELLVSMATGVIVGGALLAIIVVAQHQETTITDRVQADQIGRNSLERIQGELHSSCVGGSQIPIQKPEATTLTGLETTNGKNLWFASTFGVEGSGEAILEHGRLHDINWTETGKSNTGARVGQLTDYWFANEKIPGNYPPAEPWRFPTSLSASSAEKKVIATNVTPPEEGTTLFHYYKYDTTTSDSTYGELVPLTSTELSSMSESVRRGIAQVKIEYQQAPETHKGLVNTHVGHTTTVSGSAVLRFTPSETTEEGTGTCG